MQWRNNSNKQSQQESNDVACQSSNDPLLHNLNQVDLYRSAIRLSSVATNKVERPAPNWLATVALDMLIDDLVQDALSPSSM